MSSKLITARKGYKKPIRDRSTYINKGILDGISTTSGNLFLYGGPSDDVYYNSAKTTGLGKNNNGTTTGTSTRYNLGDLFSSIGSIFNGGSGGSNEGAGTDAVKKGMSKGTKLAIAGGITTAGSLIGNAFKSGNNHDNTGKKLGMAGTALQTAGTLSGNVWLTAAGTAAKLADDLFFTYGVENEGAMRDNTARLRNTNFTGRNNSDLINQYKNARLYTIGPGKISNGWGTDEGDELARSLGKEQALAYSLAFGNFRNAVNNAAKNLYANQMYYYSNDYPNFTAFGGQLDIKDKDTNMISNKFPFGGYYETVDPSTAIGYSLYTDKYVNNNNKNLSSMTNLFAGTPGSMFSLGGTTNTNGASFSTGLTHVNTGGSHEENPNDGVQVGVDSLNVPNLVEEGEVIYDDYVFSNRLTIPNYKKEYNKKKEAPYEALVLWNYSDLSFADAAKKIEKNTGASERPEDNVSQRGMESDLQVLAQVQEKEREKEKLKEIQEAIDNMTPEEFAALQQQIQMMQQQAQQEEIAQLEAMQLQQLQLPSEEELAMMQQLQMAAQLGMQLVAPPQLMMAANGGPIDLNAFSEGGILNTPDNMYPYGGDFAKFTQELADRGLTIKDYLDALYKNGSISDTDYQFNIANLASLDDSNFDRDLALWYLDSLKNEPSAAELKYNANNPMSRVLLYHGISPEDWDKLSDRQKARYEKLFKHTLKKADRQAFENSVNAYNKQVDMQSRVDTYRKHQRGTTISDKDIEKFQYNDMLRLAKYMNPDYKGLDFDKLSANEKDAALSKIRKDVVSLSRDNNVTIGALEDAFNSPQYHRDWKPVDAKEAWVNNGYNWDNPIYGEPLPVPVELGNTEGHWQPRDWTILDEGEYKGKIKVGDNYYDSMKDYELSDAYLNPRYALAASAAAKDEEGRKLWNDYVSGRLDPKYSGSYDPKLVFGDDFANNVGSEEEFKNYIRSNYDTLHTKDKNGHRSGFFDLIAGQMHGTYNPIMNRELYQMHDKIGDYLAPEGNWLDWYTDSIEDDGKGTIIHTLTPKGGITFNRLNGLPEGITINPDGTYKDKADATTSDPFPKAPTWPFLAGLGLLLGSLGYNILSPKDYSNADAMIKAALSAGKYTPVSFNPIGNYLKYTPDDPWFYTSPVMALSNATNRMINNRISPSNDAASIANTYNTMVALGLGTRQQLDNNFNKYAKVGEYNKDTDKFNSEGFLKADMANLDAATRARGFNLEGLKSGYAMKQAIDDAKANAINAGISGIGNLLYSYAGNKYNQDVLGWGIRHNAYAPQDVRAKKGGKLKRRKKGLSF